MENFKIFPNWKHIFAFYVCYNSTFVGITDGRVSVTNNFIFNIGSNTRFIEICSFNDIDITFNLTLYDSMINLPITVSNYRY